MLEISQLVDEINATKLSNEEEREDFRLTYLSKKGKVTVMFDLLKSASVEERKVLGKQLNELKVLAETKWKDAQEHVSQGDISEKGDFSLPGWSIPTGGRHPISSTANEIRRIFGRIGFTVAEGPEIEDDWHNFSALNFPEEHPARDMQDTFFVDLPGGMALRTHTSSVQVRILENTAPPVRVIMPGRVYRNEAISARAHCFFHQVEALYIDKNVSFADLKQTLNYFATEMFGNETKIRLRPSYFPFTEPSAEMDISCTVCKGKGCPICKYSGWVEILGCGMVHPNVLKNCSIDPNEFSGFALGMGIERVALLRYQIKDLRLFSQNDIRFLKQFKHSW
jgi:phenylalanyl-tRNA synthetase alpha chain